MDLDTTLLIHTERTPNPAAVKWVLDRPILTSPGRVTFEPGVSAEVSPLAYRLFAVPGVAGVLLADEFLVVNREDQTEWRDVGQAVTQTIRDWVATGEPALGEGYEAPAATPDDEILVRIRRILENEIAPYVQSDGGEISLEGFSNGVVEVSLRGACVGCPSSAVTLRMGVEARLREEIPEVQSVVAV